MLLYKTKEWKGYGKQNYYWNEYCLEDGIVVQYKCNRHKWFDGKENEWEYSKEKAETWAMDDPNMPDWLPKYFPKNE